jgi:hypothetical protein
MELYCIITTCSNCVISRNNCFSVSSLRWVRVRQPGSCPQTRYLNWFGTETVKSRGIQQYHIKTREVFKMSQVCHTCKQTAQHPLVKHPAIWSRQLPLMDRKFFKMGQVWGGVVWREKLFVSEVLRKYDVCVVRQCFWQYQAKAQLHKPLTWNFLQNVGSKTET